MLIFTPMSNQLIMWCILSDFLYQILIKKKKKNEKVHIPSKTNTQFVMFSQTKYCTNVFLNY